MVEIDHVTKRYGDKVAVEDLTFAVKPGIVTGFLGPNGAGKSTTMRVILGLDRPHSGTATVNGKAYRDLPAPLHEIGALLGARAIHAGRSAYHHLVAMAPAAVASPARATNALSPWPAPGTLEQASRTGRQALAELRQTLGVLRDPPAGPQLAPLPGIRQIEDLVQQIRAAGVPVNYTRSGEPTASPPGLELAVYRIVQEALTNTLKHAGDGARATVTVACADDRIEIEVIDTASPPLRRAPAGPGCAGCASGPRLTGATSWRVRAPATAGGSAPRSESPPAWERRHERHDRARRRSGAAAGRLPHGARRPGRSRGRGRGRGR